MVIAIVHIGSQYRERPLEPRYRTRAARKAARAVQLFGGRRRWRRGDAENDAWLRSAKKRGLLKISSSICVADTTYHHPNDRRRNTLPSVGVMVRGGGLGW